MALHREVTPHWRKSSRSGGGNCVEAAALPSAILLRDSKDVSAGPVLRIQSGDWVRFLEGVKAGEFDLK